MLDRFTETAKKIVAEAKEVANSYNHQEIRNEHLLAAFLKQKNALAYKMIMQSFIPGFIMQKSLDLNLKSASESPADSIGFDSYFKKTIERSFKFAENMGFNWISTALILVGMIESESPITPAILKSWGFESNTLMETIKNYGDLNGNEESMGLIPNWIEPYTEISNYVSADIEKVILHSCELAKTYENFEVNFYHFLLSLAFLAKRKVINIEPLDSKKLNLEKVKDLVASKLAPTEKNPNHAKVFSRDVFKLCSLAVHEALLRSAEKIEMIDIAIGIALVNEDAALSSFDLNYGEMRMRFSKSIKVESFESPDVNDKQIFPTISLRRYNADPGAVIMIPQDYAEEWGVMALSLNDNVLTVAMLNPDDEAIREKIEDITGMEIAVLKADAKDLKAAFRMNY